MGLYNWDYTEQIVVIAAFNGGFLLLVLLLLCMGKYLRDNYLENTEITVDQESQETNSQIFGPRHISIIRTISHPSYENAITCQKVETPPPNYLDLFFLAKLPPPTLDSISEV